MSPAHITRTLSFSTMLRLSCQCDSSVFIICIYIFAKWELRRHHSKWHRQKSQATKLMPTNTEGRNIISADGKVNTWQKCCPQQLLEYIISCVKWSKYAKHISAPSDDVEMKEIWIPSGITYELRHGMTWQAHYYVLCRFNTMCMAFVQVVGGFFDAMIIITLYFV